MIISKIEKLAEDKIYAFDSILFEKFIEEKELEAYQIYPALCIQEQFLVKNSKFHSYLEDERSKNNTQITPQKTFFYKIKRELRKIVNRKEKIPFK